MSDLPQIDPTKLSQKLLAKNSDLTYQLAQLEVLAEALRDERDTSRTELAEARQQLAESKESKEPVADITSLPSK